MRLNSPARSVFQLLQVQRAVSPQEAESCLIQRQYEFCHWFQSRRMFWSQLPPSPPFFKKTSQTRQKSSLLRWNL